jgi:hypothetical protein
MKKNLLFFLATFLILSCNKDKISTVETAVLVDPIVFEQSGRVIIDDQQAAQFPNTKRFTTEERDNAINNYWIQKVDQKKALISMTELELVYAMSDDKNKVMFKVTNIEDKEKVDIVLLPYKKELIEKSYKTPNYYFLFERKYFDGFNAPTMPNGIKYNINNLSNMVSVRLGKNDKQFQVFVEIYNPTGNENKINPRNSMPDGGASGVPLP